MADKMSEVYEAYDMEIYQTMRGRGSFILNTDKGIRQLRQLDESESRLNVEYQFKEELYESGFTHIDRCVKNIDDELVSYDRYGNGFVMRMFFEGREIDVQNKDEIKNAVLNLADFHTKSREIFRNTERDVHIRLNSDFRKRNLETKRVKNFMLKRKSKKKFEEIYLDNYEFFYNQAVECERRLDEKMLEKMSEHTGYCHGMYNRHSILINEEKDEYDTIGFDRFYVGNQLNDLYHFMRKTVEKNDYDFEIMKEITEIYADKCALSQNDLKYIYTLYLYPEKFYKLGNQYINAPKNWISPKMMEKIGKIIADETKKQDLLGKFNRFYLEN